MLLKTLRTSLLNYLLNKIKLVGQVKRDHSTGKILESIGLFQAVPFSSIRLFELWWKFWYLHSDEYIFCYNLRAAVVRKLCCSLVWYLYPGWQLFLFSSPPSGLGGKQALQKGWVHSVSITLNKLLLPSLCTLYPPTNCCSPHFPGSTDSIIP